MRKVLVGLMSAAAVLAFAFPANATPSICDAVAGNLVQNCGFEGGFTFDGFGEEVPNNWTPGGLWDSGFNGVSGNSNSGNAALQIGNLDTQEAPTLNQTLTDTAGTLYSGSIFVEKEQPNPTGSDFFDVQINGVNVLALPSGAAGIYTEYFFSFTGTGSDLLTLTANTNPAEWLADDVVVTSSPVGHVPEPLTLSLFGAGIVGAVALRRRKANKQA